MTNGHDTNIVVVALIVRDNKILIAKRAATKQTWPDRFELPGGHVDPGETLRAALIREVKEEIGVEVQVGDVVDAFTYQSENTFKVEICYFCTIKAGQEPTLNPADHSEFRWIGVDELSLFEKDDEEVAATRKAFKLLERGEQ